jgi:uncharacterized short protein YbdD (DUF466 family)
MRDERKERKLRKKRNDSVTTVLHSIQILLRRVAGMPDYQRHLEHLRRCHPERPIPTERQYFEQYLEGRYQDGPTRCC